MKAYQASILLEFSSQIYLGIDINVGRYFVITAARQSCNTKFIGFWHGQAAEPYKNQSRKETHMKEPYPTPPKPPYTPPRLEQHPSFVTITGASFPFGTVLTQEGESE